MYLVESDKEQATNEANWAQKRNTRAQRRHLLLLLIHLRRSILLEDIITYQGSWDIMIKVNWLEISQLQAEQ